MATAGGCAPDASLWGLSAIVIAEKQSPFTGSLASSSGWQATGQWSPFKISISQEQVLGKSPLLALLGGTRKTGKEETLTSVKEVIDLMGVGRWAWLLEPSIHNCHPSAQRGNLAREAFR